MSAPLLKYHREMVTDPVRMQAWRCAIQRTVQPGDVVVDVGAGTGVLSFLACAAGARSVYAIEEASIIEVAREVAQQTPFADRITFFAKSSAEVRLPEPADVLLGDVFGAFGLNGNMLATLIDARARFLRPGGTVLPRAAELYCVPVEFTGFYSEAIDGWSADVCGFDFRAARSRAVNQMHLTSITAEAALAEPSSLGRADVARAETAAWKGSTEFAICRAGTLHGIGGWCRAVWDSDISTTNSPFVTPRLDWHQAFFPIETAVSVRPGDRVRASFELATHGPWMIWSWIVDLDSAASGGKRFRHSTFQGELLSLDDIRRQCAEFIPRSPSRE